MRRYIVNSFIFCWFASFAYCAAPMGQGHGDLLLCSSLGFDRSPCSLEWWQYNPGWQWGDYRYLRLTNETWTDVAVGKLFDGSKKYLFASVDNNMGYSAVVHWLMDEYGGLQAKGELLPNEPWRHYEGVTVCDLDKDRKPDVLTVASNRIGQRGVFWFKLNRKRKLLQEKMIIKLKAPACGLASLSISPKATDLFVVYPGNKIRGGRVTRYRISSKGIVTKTDPSFLRISPRLGEAGGVAFEFDKDQKNVRMVLCTHDWGEQDNRHKKKRKAFKTDSGFILPSWDINRIKSYLYRSKYPKNRKPGKLVKVDSIKARRWTGVAFGSAFKQPKFSSKKTRHIGGSRIVQLCGLFHNSYKMDKLAAQLNMKLDKHYVKQYQQKCMIPNYNFDNLSRYDMLFVIDVPLWALGQRGVNAIQNYVRSGGTLVFCDGPLAGKVGGYAGSPIEEILPVKIKGAGFDSMAWNDLVVDNAYLKSSVSDEVYYLPERYCKPQAQSIVRAEEQTILAKWRVGAGYVIYVGCIPLTNNKNNDFPVWNSLKWAKLLEGISKSHNEE